MPGQIDSTPGADGRADPTARVIGLDEIRPHHFPDVGGKAAGLAGLIAAGFPVPPGFCITTAAYREGAIEPEVLRAALARFGDTPVAVRSSATAEDLPDASFAGQQDSVLNVRGAAAVGAAIRQIWDSLHAPRATAYRRAQAIAEEPEMAVVVQRMVEPRAAGVLFTVHPITQTRGRAAIDAVAGLGTGVVDGSRDADHYTIDRDDVVTGPDDGCLTREELLHLVRTGRRVEEALGGPQDVEWALDRDGTLWLLQSRAITSLFPLVRDPDDGRRAFMEVGHMQGMHGPTTPMGQSVLEQAMREWLEPLGLVDVPADAWMTYIGDRMYLELTPYLRSRATRSRLDRSLDVYGPRVKGAVLHLRDDPRFAPTRAFPLRGRTLARVVLRVLPPLLVHCVAAVVDPPRDDDLERLRATLGARERAFAAADRLRDGASVPAEVDAATRLRLTSRLQKPIMHAADAQLGCLYGSFLARAIAAGLLRGIAGADEINETQRGMPHNVTVDMDLALWAVAERARPHARLLTQTPPAELARRYHAGDRGDRYRCAALARGPERRVRRAVRLPAGHRPRHGAGPSFRSGGAGGAGCADAAVVAGDRASPGARAGGGVPPRPQSRPRGYAGVAEVQLALPPRPGARGGAAGRRGAGPARAARTARRPHDVALAS